MRKPWRVATELAAIALVAVMLAVPWYASTASAIDSTGTRATVTFTVGGQDQMKTRNWLPSIANDVWTSDVLGRVYDTVGQTDPVTDALKVYIIKGVDVDGDENFDRAEKGAFLKGPCQPAPCDALTDRVWRRTVVAYYDFNGVYYHDDVQADLSDVMFNYVMQSLNPRFNTDMRVLWDDPNAATFPASRHLNIDWLWGGVSGGTGPSDIQWEGASTAPGDNSLRGALRFRLQDDFALFYRSTLSGLTLFPRHGYEGTGGGRHANFGNAIYPATWAMVSKRLQGIPTDETAITPFNYPAAEGWQMTDADVIGTGPFRFGTWSTGAFARVDKYTKYFYGVDPNSPTVVLDQDLLGYIHQPFIDQIVYLIYRTTQLGVLALQAGTIDFYHWALPPEFVGDLLNDPNIRVWANAEPGFFYMAYNMRRQPFGYTAYPPPAGLEREPSPTCPTCVDAGLPFRRAFAHLIDKATIVRVLLQNYGVIADGTLSPANTFWYNGTLPNYAYDPSQAAAILDNAGWTDTDGDGWREFPRLGDTQFEILTPHADYDPIRASVGALLASAARGIGVNVISKPATFGIIVTALEVRSFDVAISHTSDIHSYDPWTLTRGDPEYLFDLFHSSNAPAGRNAVGFFDVPFDGRAEGAGRSGDYLDRSFAVRDAEGILAERLPVVPAYYRNLTWVYRSDRYTGWKLVSSTLFNYWSLQDLQAVPNPAPQIALVSPPDGAIIPPGVVIDLDIFDTDTTWVSSAWDGGAGARLFPPYDIPTSSLPDGPHQLRVYALDQAGNSATTYYSFAIDGTPPAIALVSPLSSLIPGDTIVDFSVSDAHLAAVGIRVDGGSLVPLSAPYDYAVSGLSDGVHTFQVGAIDLANNVAVRIFTFTLDATRPAVVGRQPQGTAPTAPAEIRVDFSEPVNTTSVEAAFLVTDGTRVWRSADGTFSWSANLTSFVFTPNPPFTAGHEYRVVLAGSLTDEAGNGMGPEVSWTFSTSPVGPNAGPWVVGAGIAAVIAAVISALLLVVLIRRRKGKEPTIKPKP